MLYEEYCFRYSYFQKGINFFILPHILFIPTPSSIVLILYIGKYIGKLYKILEILNKLITCNSEKIRRGLWQLHNIGIQITHLCLSSSPFTLLSVVLLSSTYLLLVITLSQCKSLQLVHTTWFNIPLGRRDWVYCNFSSNVLLKTYHILFTTPHVSLFYLIIQTEDLICLLVHIVDFTPYALIYPLPEPFFPPPRVLPPHRFLPLFLFHLHLLSPPFSLSLPLLTYFNLFLNYRSTCKSTLLTLSFTHRAATRRKRKKVANYYESSFPFWTIWRAHASRYGLTR